MITTLQLKTNREGEMLKVKDGIRPLIIRVISVNYECILMFLIIRFILCSRWGSVSTYLFLTIYLTYVGPIVNSVRVALIIYFNKEGLLIAFQRGRAISA